MQRLDDYLKNMDDEQLLQIEEELIAEVVPATGAAHAVIRTINNLIDKGAMCINTTTYRKVYLPTFARAVQKELARRYYNLFKYQGGHYATSNHNSNV